MIAYLSRNTYRIIELLLAALLAIVLAYYSTIPKAVISNLSDTEYTEFIVSLPTSRISFSPITPGSTSTIYFSRQGKPGSGTYSLLSGEIETASGNFTYAAGSELGRVLKFTINNSGLVLFDEALGK